MAFEIRNITAMVLGGGRGQRLYPLTKYRSKPAVPIGGKFRLIDIPISNCLHAGINRIFILTQFNSLSLHRHIEKGYKFDKFTHGFIQILAAQQTLKSDDWYQGTADAVRQNLDIISNRIKDSVLILSADHLYRMDFSEMIKIHEKSDADITIAALPVNEEDVSRFGILKADEEGTISEFVEKPTDRKIIEEFRVPQEAFERRKLKTNGETHIASMGIYLFKKGILEKTLEMSEGNDFGKHVIPSSIGNCKVNAFFYQDYWADIGTISAFYEANLKLVQDVPEFDFYHPKNPIYTNARYLPGCKIGNCDVTYTLLCDGSIIEHGVKIDNSIIGIRSIIKKDSKISNSIVMGADLFDSELVDGVSIGIGSGCEIDRAIIDKNARIGNNVRIRSAEGKEDAETDLYVIKDGIVVIPKNTLIPDGTVI